MIYILIYRDQAALILDSTHGHRTVGTEAVIEALGSWIRSRIHFHSDPSHLCVASIYVEPDDCYNA